MATTLDTLLDGRVALEQPAPGHGYRVNADAVLLARFASETAEAAGGNAPDGIDVIDLGAGVGAVALVLAALVSVRSIVLVERDGTMAELAERNARHARLSDRTKVFATDVEPWAAGFESRDGALVVANPPYTQPGSGRHGTNASRNAARHGEVAPFIRATKTLLSGTASRACMCYPASNAVSLLAAAASEGLRTSRVRFVHPTPTLPARIVLVELTCQCVGPKVLPPWFDADSSA